MPHYLILIISSAILLPNQIVQCQTNPKTTDTTNNEQPTIVIIGAGLSGLAAADRLINKYGFQNVKILEAQDRVGGRVYPVPYEQTFIQMGAEWLHHRNNSVFEIALQLGLIPSRNVTPDDFINGVHNIDQNSCEIPDRLTDALKPVNLLNAIHNVKGDSYGDRMDKFYRQFIQKNAQKFNASDVKVLDALMHIYGSSIEQYYSAEDWHYISREEFEGDADDDDDDSDEGAIAIHLNKFGYKPILDEMTKRVPPKNHIQFNSMVQHIHWNNNGTKAVEIELTDGRLVPADHVIVTCSLGHLKRYVNQLFHPPLPKNKMDTIQTLGFGTVDKFLLIFDKPWWPKDTTGINFLRVEENPGMKSCRSTPPFVETNLTKMLEVAYVSQVYPNQLLFWISGHDPPTFENATDADLIKAATTVLRNYFINVTIPQPRIMRSSWYSNPLFLGSYSYNSVACEKIKGKRKYLAEPLKIEKQNRTIPVVQFAGEATHSEYATTHGAFMSGEREADRLGAFYQRR